MEHQFIGLDDKLINYVIYIVGDNEEITLDTDLYNIIDDMDCISFIIELEDEFDIIISDDIVDNFFTSNCCTLKNLKKY